MEGKQFKKLKKVECLYKGNGREVNLYRDRETGQKWVAKTLDRRSLSSRESQEFLKEARIMSSLDHQNIISFQDILQTESEIVIGGNRV